MILSDRAQRLVVEFIYIARWMATCFVSAIGIGLGLLFTVVIASLGAWLCPQRIKTEPLLCSDSWSQHIFQNADGFGAAMAACLVVLLPSLVAPHHKDVVAAVAFVIGANLAFVFGMEFGFKEPFWFAIVAGLIALGWVLRRRWFSSFHEA